MSESKITAEDFVAILREGMGANVPVRVEVLSIERGSVAVRSITGADDLRPGQTVSGPALFALADLAMYAVVMSAIGPVRLAVTTDATIHFLRRPPAGAYVARARLLKEGAKLMVGDVLIAPEGHEDAPVAHAVMTYSVPPASGAVTPAGPST